MSTNLTRTEAEELAKDLLVNHISQEMYDCDPNILIESYTEDDWEEDDMDLLFELVDTAIVELVVTWASST